MDYQAMVALSLVDERKNMQKAAMIALAVMILMLVLALIWPAVLGTVPPPGEKQYELMGSIDFGMDDLGQMDVNTFEDPSPTPSEEDPAPAEETPVVEENPVQQEQVTANDIITTNDDNAENAVVNNNSQVKDPDPDPNPNVNKDPNPKKVDEVPDFNTTNDNNGTGNSDSDPGSNHGNSNQTGNRGTDVQVLDPNGMFSFGQGSGDGLNGRMPVSLPQPSYKVQEEAKITFKFKISPSGKVSYVKPPITPHAGLKKAGMDAVYKWTFNKVPTNHGDQWTQVTITFRLK